MVIVPLYPVLRFLGPVLLTVALLPWTHRSAEAAGPRFRAQSAQTITQAVRMNTRQIFKPSFAIASRHAQPMTAVGRSADALWFASGKQTGEIQVWNVQNGQREAQLMGHRAAVNAVVFAPALAALATTPPDPAIKILKSRQFLASGGADGDIILWRVETQSPLQRMAAHAGGVSGLALAAEGQLWSAGADGQVKLWRPGQSAPVRSWTLDGAVLALAAAPDGKSAAAATAGGITWLGIQDAKPRLQWSAAASTALAFHPGGSVLASGNGQGQVILWSLPQGERRKEATVTEGPVVALAFDPAGQLLAAADDKPLVRLLGALDLEKKAVLAGHQGAVRDLTFLGDRGNHLISAAADRTLRVWDPQGRVETSRLVSLKDGWAVVTPSGFFDGTLDGDLEDRLDAIQWAGDGHAFTLDGFMEKYYRPALLGRLLMAGDQESGFQQALAAPKVETDGFYLPPRVEVLSDSGDRTRSAKARVTVDATDQGGGVNEVRLYHNGKAVGSELAVQSVEEQVNGRTVRKTIFEVELVEGENAFRTLALSNDRIEGEAARLQTVYEAMGEQSKPVFHVFVVGINKYALDDLDLNFALPDAKGVLDFFLLSQGGLYERVITYELYDGDATQTGIRRAMEDMKKLRPQDVVVFYFAGHGETVGEDWFFIPHDLKDFENAGIKAQGISAHTLKELVAGIPAQRVVVMFDACKSGAAADAWKEFEGVKSMALLSRSAGIHLATASTGDQYANEIGELGHGVFTYAILEGLNGGADRPPEDQYVSVEELFAFLKEHVPYLNRKYQTDRQNPVTSARGIDFRVSKP
ncbi:MAG: caspase family protein [Magnetococcus sp. WYHC-3]